MSTRFADPGHAMYDLTTHFVVQCPKCAGKALVQPKQVGHKLICTQCHHTETPGHWYGAMTASVHVKCRECHHQLSRSAPWDGHWKKLMMHCDNCGDACEYEASISRHWIHNGLVTDNVYGLPLWLQTTFRGEQLWAFHYEHLEILRSFIAAKHRERGISPRNTIRKNTSILSRLPAFILKAGNRKALLKFIDALQVK